MMKLPRVKYIICCLIVTLTKAIRLTTGEKPESIHKQRESACQCRRPKRRRSDPWLGNIPERRKRQPTPALLPGESMDRGACWAAVHGVAEGRTQLCDRAHTRAQTPLLLFYFLRHLKIILSFGSSWLKWRRRRQETGKRRWGQAGRTLLSTVRSLYPSLQPRAGP